MKGRWACNDCDWIEVNRMSAPHPFIPGDTIYGCPHCGGIDLNGVCEIDGCDEIASCGTPTKGGYARCCGKHFSEEQERNK